MSDKNSNKLKLIGALIGILGFAILGYINMSEYMKIEYLPGAIKLIGGVFILFSIVEFIGIKFFTELSTRKVIITTLLSVILGVFIGIGFLGLTKIENRIAITYMIGSMLIVYRKKIIEIVAVLQSIQKAQ